LWTCFCGCKDKSKIGNSKKSSYFFMNKAKKHYFRTGCRSKWDCGSKRWR